MGLKDKLLISSVLSLIVIFISIALLNYSGEITVSLMLIYILAFIISINILFYSWGKPLDIFEPIFIFSLVYFILFVLRPIYIILADDYYFLDIVGASDEYFPQVLVCLILGYVVFLVGYRTKSKGIISLLNKMPKININEIFIPKAVVASLFLFLVGIVTYIYFYRFKMSVNPGVEVFRESTAYIYYGLDLMVPAVIGVFFLRNKLLALKAVYIIILIISIYIFTSLYARYRLVAMILSLTFLYYMQKDKRPKVTSTLLVVPVVLMIFALTGIRRGITQRGINLGEILEIIMSKDIIMRFVSSVGDAAMFDFLVLYFQEIPKNINYLYGLGFLQILIHPIPRIIWETKPIQTSAYFMSRVLPEFYEHGVGFASSILGDLYWNFGLVGIILGMFIIGKFLKSAYLWFIENKNFLSAQITYAFILLFTPMYMRGEFVGTSVWFLFMLVPALLILKVSRK